MKKTALITAAWAVLMMAGCDDLSAPPQSPFIPPPKQEAASPVTPPTLNRAFMEEVFNYTSQNLATMRQHRDAMMAMPEESENYAGRRSFIVSQNEDLRHRLYIRQEWMGGGDFGMDHPSRKIRIAIYYLMEESKHIDNVFSFNEPLDPKFAEATDQAMREAAQALINYKDPPKRKRDHQEP